MFVITVYEFLIKQQFYLAFLLVHLREIRKGKLFHKNSSANCLRQNFFHTNSLSFHGLRSKTGMSLQWVQPEPRGRYWNGCRGTSVMLVLSQMMRASDVPLREALWASVKTPGFSHHCLKGIQIRQLWIYQSTNNSRPTNKTICFIYSTGLLGESSGTGKKSSRQTRVPHSPSLSVS